MVSKRSIGLLLLLCFIIGISLLYQSNTAPDFEADFNMFTSEEHLWLSENPVIYYAPDHDFYPFEFYEDERYQGFSLDYIKWINDNYDLGIEIVSYNTWDSIMGAVKNKEIDLVSSTAHSPYRDSFMLFTIPYTSMDFVAFIHEDTNDNFYNYDLPEMKTAVIKNYITQDILQERYPNIELILVDSSDEGFTLLNDKKIDVFIASAGQSIRSIEDLNLTKIRANEKVRILSSAPLHLGTHTDHPQLVTILTKILKTMPQSEKDKIFDTWIHIEFSDTFTATQYKRTFIVIVAISVFIVFVFVWNQLLKYKVDQKSDAVRQELKERYKLETQLKNIINAIPSPIYVRNEAGIFLHVNQAFCDVFGVQSPSEIENSPNSLLNVLTDESINRFNQLSQAVLTDHNPQRNHKNKVTLLNSQSYTVDSLKIPFKLLESNQLGVLSIDVDITKRERIRQELEDANQNLEATVNERSKAIQDLNDELTQALNKISANKSHLQETNAELNVLLQRLTTTQQELIEKETMGTQGLRLSQIAQEISEPIINIKSKNQKVLDLTTDLLKTFKDDKLQTKGLTEKLLTIEKNTKDIRSRLKDSSSIVETFKLISIVDHGLQPTRVNLKLMLETCYNQTLLKKPENNVDCSPDILLQASPNAFHQIIIHIIKFISSIGNTDEGSNLTIYVEKNTDNINVVFEHQVPTHIPAQDPNREYKITDLGLQIIESILNHYFSGTLVNLWTSNSFKIIMTIPSIFIANSEPDDKENKEVGNHA